MGAGIVLALSIVTAAPAMAADDVSDVDVTTAPTTEVVNDGPTELSTMQATVPSVEVFVDSQRQSSPLMIGEGSSVNVNISNLTVGDSVEGDIVGPDGSQSGHNENRSEGGALSLDFTVKCEQAGGSIVITRTIGETGDKERVPALSLQAAPGACPPPETEEPPTTEPEPTDPAPTDPAPTDPVDPTDPAPTDPVDPDPTDPPPTDPAPTDPAPTDPAEPTEPAPTDPVDPVDPAEPTTSVAPSQPAAPPAPAGPESPASPVPPGSTPAATTNFGEAGSNLRERLAGLARVERPQASASEQPVEDLPHTGASVEAMGAMALGLMAAGGVTLAARRRSDA